MLFESQELENAGIGRKKTHEWDATYFGLLYNLKSGIIEVMPLDGSHK